MFCLNFVYNGFPSDDELLCLQNIGLTQFENQNLSRPNHNFCHFVVNFKEFVIGGWLECQN